MLSVETIGSLVKDQDHVHRWHEAARAAWEAWSIPSAADKSVSSSVNATELGCEIDGKRGVLGATRDRRLQVIAMTLHLIGADRPHRLWLAICAGRWNFCFQS